MLPDRLKTVLAICLLGAASQAWATGLVWDRLNIDVAAQPGQRVVSVSFPFRNSESGPVTLVSIETSCRCLSADVPKMRYGPGEKGAVGVDFTVGNQTGVQDKSVIITTDDVREKPVRLVLRV